MNKLYDFQCLTCNHTFEDLISEGEDLPSCPVCENPTELLMFCNNPTKPHNPKWAKIFEKDANIKNKLRGVVPWRKSSESRSD